MSECHTDEIQDGDVLRLTLVGGTTHFNSTIYSTSGWYCEPMATDTYQGPERAFHFQHPGGSQNCIVTLESNCGDLSLGALVWDVNTQAVQRKVPILLLVNGVMMSVVEMKNLSYMNIIPLIISLLLMQNYQ